MPSKTVVKEYYCKKNTKVDITERVLKGPEERLNFSCKLLLYTCTCTIERVPMCLHIFFNFFSVNFQHFQHFPSSRSQHPLLYARLYDHG